jgi:hypothetical protein
MFCQKQEADLGNFMQKLGQYKIGRRKPRLVRRIIFRAEPLLIDLRKSRVVP